MDSHSDGKQPVAGGPGAPQSSRRRRPRTLLALTLILAGAQPAGAIGNSSPPPRLRVACVKTTQQPNATIRAWLRTYVIGSAIPCRLSAAGYYATEPPLRYRLALVYPLGPESKPGHRLYLVFLIASKRAARYLLDLHPDAHRHWLVDLWAEL